MGSNWILTPLGVAILEFLYVLCTNIGYHTDDYERPLSVLTCVILVSVRTSCFVYSCDEKTRIAFGCADVCALCTVVTK